MGARISSSYYFEWRNYDDRRRKEIDYFLLVGKGIPADRVRVTCPCCKNRHLYEYMLNCLRCQARDIARTPARRRDEILSKNEHLRELAREEFREDMRQLRGIDATKPDVDKVRSA